MTIHHATLKKAAALGIQIIETDGEFTATYEGVSLTAATAKEAVECMAQHIRDETIGELADADADADVEAEDDATDADFAEEAEAEDDDKPASRSVVPAPYRKKYAPHNDTNGDEVNALFREEFGTENEDGEWRLDLPKFKRFAQANGLWSDKYDRLNPGMVRMNVTNRYRHRCRKDPKWAAKWPG